jgi:hypothetical protein
VLGFGGRLGRGRRTCDGKAWEDQKKGCPKVGREWACRRDEEHEGWTSRRGLRVCDEEKRVVIEGLQADE